MSLMTMSAWRAERTITAAFDSWSLAKVAAASLVSELGLREAQVELVAGNAAERKPTHDVGRMHAAHYLLRKHGGPTAIGAVLGSVAFALLFAGGLVELVQSPAATLIAAMMWAMATVGGFLMGGVVGESLLRRNCGGHSAEDENNFNAKIVVRPVSVGQYRRAMDCLATWGVTRVRPA